MRLSITNACVIYPCLRPSALRYYDAGLLQPSYTERFEIKHPGLSTLFTTAHKISSASENV